MSENNEKNNENLVITCPHCETMVLIEKLNCGIFRHGILKKTGTIINQHLDKSACDLLVKNDLIHGCGKPFQVIIKDGCPVVTICEYI